MKQCIICNESVPPGRVLSSHERWGHVLCKDCYDRADEIGHIPAIVLNKGWDAYDENVSGEPSEAAPSETDQSCDGEETDEKGYTNTENVPTTYQSDVLPPAKYAGDIVRPAVTAGQAIAAWNEFQDLKRAIIDVSDLQSIGGKSFVKKSGWRKLAQYFNLSDEIVSEVCEPHMEGGGWTWTIKVKVMHPPTGRFTIGVGKCSTSERKFAHVEHDTYATAHTRAKNRAISDMIAAGEVSAEEVSA